MFVLTGGNSVKLDANQIVAYSSNVSIEREIIPLYISTNQTFYKAK